MASPIAPYVVNVTASSSASGEEIKVSNLTSGDHQVIALNTDKKAIVELSNFANGWADGDLILIEQNGKNIGSGTHTCDADGAQPTATALGVGASATVGYSL